jgi:ribosomal protein L22
MSDEDRYSAAEFARRYKVTEVDFAKLCEQAGIARDTILSREEFRKLLDDFRRMSFKPRRSVMENLKEKTKAIIVVKEEKVKEGKKAPFERLVKKAGLTPAKAAVLKTAMDWGNSTPISQKQFEDAVNKHLYNRT